MKLVFVQIGTAMAAGTTSNSGFQTDMSEIVAASVQGLQFVHGLNFEVGI